MPIYEYHCQTCGTFEVNQRITAAPLRRCPACNGKVRKLISSTSFQLKGSGWYVTDYASKGNGGEKGTPGGESKSESKPPAEGVAKSSTPSPTSSKKGEATAS